MIKNIIYLAVLLLFSLSNVTAQKNVIAKSEEQLKMFNAQQRFFEGDFQSALSIYQDILTKKPTDANLIGHIAECYFEMGHYREALENAEKAKGIDKNAYDKNYFVLGRIYNINGKLDEALVEFKAFKAIVGDSKKAKETEIDSYINNVNTAKQLMANPVNVTIADLGTSINSDFDDKTPSITADAKTLIFTSRRPGKNRLVDVEGDRKYFEDVYISHFDTLKKSWSVAELIPGSINTDGHDACSSISPDGKQIFIYRNEADGESRGGDIYVSRLNSIGKWGAPKTIGKPVNTTYWEGGACIAPDGKTLYLVTERPGGFGHGDIYVVKQKTKTEWDEPVNIGSEINTSEDEGGIFLAPDGKTLFFSSKGHNNMGGYDIFKTVNENGKWSKPVNLGYPINTINNDMSFSISVDAKTGYFTSDRKAVAGDRDIYKVDLTDYPVLEKDMKTKVLNTGPVMAILKGDVFDASKGSGLEAELVIYDETGAKVGSTTSSAESGEYFITLLAGKTYQVKIDLKDYKSIAEKVEIKIAKDGATTVVKHYLLYKK